MESAARGEAQSFEPRRGLDLGRAAAFTVAPAIAIDNEASEAATVVEVSGRDRPGLLVALTRTLADAGLSIQSAHVDNNGERAVDAFYVSLPSGAKLTDRRKIGALKQALDAVLQDVEPEATKARPRLQRARASSAR
jgi:[protein-PII] uridylyltransferase